MRHRHLILAVYLSCCAACAPQATTPEPPPLTQADVQSFFDRYSDLWMAGDIEGWLALWADNETIVQMPPNEPRVVGMSALRARNAGAIASARFENVAITNLEVRSSGDIAFASGTYTMDITPPGGSPFKLDAKYMSIFERQGDGSWKLIRDAFNPNTPAG